MRKVFLHWFILLLFFSISEKVASRTLGNFKSYRQCTDKQIVIETTSGVKILFNAIDNQMLGISVYEPGEEANIITPSKIIENNSLTGSIYIEELDDLMQITTTTNDGLVIKISKYPLGFSYCNKQTDEPYINLGNNLLIRNESIEFQIASCDDEKIDILTKGEQTNMINLNKGDSFVDPNGAPEQILLSSKGYALHFNNYQLLTFNHSQTGKISIEIQKTKNEPYRFCFIYGANLPELDGKVVFNQYLNEPQVF